MRPFFHHNSGSADNSK